MSSSASISTPTLPPTTSSNSRTLLSSYAYSPTILSHTLPRFTKTAAAAAAASRKMTVPTNKDADCLFCKIIDGKIPSYKLAETESAYAFLDIGPLSPGHSLVIPKYHAAKLHELPDETLGDILTLAKRVAIASGATDYNILQNNGAIAHQVVNHVHFHMIPKPDEKQGLGVGWPATSPSKEDLQKLFEDMKQKL